jgi:hypothetical protein
MKANRIHRFGPPEVIVIDDIARPTPKPDELVVRVAAAGVGPWDALIREHKSAVNISLPVILGSDLAGCRRFRGISGHAIQARRRGLRCNEQRFLRSVRRIRGGPS